MKSYLPIIASLFLASTPFTTPAVAAETKIIAQEISPYIKDNIAREISVKITSEENAGSGVMIAQQDNTYLILTNAHVLREDGTFNVQTHDGVSHKAKPVTNGIETDDDLALLEFSSNNSYQTATINSAAAPRIDQSILAVGYDAVTGELATRSGTIERVADKTLKEGYSIGYSNNIVQGMSGGAILNANGEVIGVNGKSAFPIVNTGYVYQDGTKPTPDEIEQMRQLSWGISLNLLLTKLDSKIIAAYNLPLPKTTADINNAKLTGWIGELETKAKQFTVRIDSSSGANGSGVIIAKEGNIYTVLTAAHVICEKNQDNNCLNYNYKVKAPDGNKYSLDPITFKRQEGVDLAVVRFISKEQYQVAELANYSLTETDAVFVGGYPKLNNNTAAKWKFNLGYVLDRETGLSTINDSSLSIDSSDLTDSTGSLSGGYEMVYSSITYGGMSGGAVLDRDGRVIGIHGLSEGETAFDSQNSSSTPIQLGYSLGIPINTFVGLADRFEINPVLSIQNNKPKELSSAEETIFETAFLDVSISEGNATAERWIERGNQLWRLLRYDEAVEAFDRAIALNPEFIHLAYYGKSLALSYQDRGEAALASLELATKIQLNFAPIFVLKSSVLRKLNRLDEALTAIDRAIALQDNNANSYLEKGIILLQLGRYLEAEVAFQKSIDIYPRDNAYLLKGSCLRHSRKSRFGIS